MSQSHKAIKDLPSSSGIGRQRNSADIPATKVVPDQISHSAIYCDGRPPAPLRMEARDHGMVFEYGRGPEDCDHLGAREAWIFQHKDLYYMTYDGAGPKGWLVCLATSRDLFHWERHGPILDFGQPGSSDSATASYGTIFEQGGKWHMYYLGSPNASSAPNHVPMFPYLTHKAEADSPRGPWRKRYDIIPWRNKPGSWYADVSSPGRVIEHQGEFLQFLSGSIKLSDERGQTVVKRTLGIARTRDLEGSWKLDSEPIVPLDHQIENSDLYFEPANGTWFLFTNHIGIIPPGGSDRIEMDETENSAGLEFTDAVWVYWTKDPNRWNPEHKAVVLDGGNCNWSKRCIGLPGVSRVGNRLVLLYDAPGGESVSHMRRSIGLAWLELPLVPPV